MSVQPHATNLETMLRQCPAGAQHETAWMDGLLRLRVSAHLCDGCPPDELVTSVRCIVLRGSQALVMSNVDGDHILPGGRREPGESFLDTLRREVLEEAAMTVRDAWYLGFLLFHHLGPKPNGYRYPYPDFAQVVYAATFDAFVADGQSRDDYEQSSVFRAWSDSTLERLPPTQRHFLDAAIDTLRYR